MPLRAPHVLLATLLLAAGLYATRLGRKRAPDQHQLQALYKLSALADTPFDAANKEHARLLALVKERFGIEDDWRAMGFQRRETPVTDFRAFGVLALHCLVHTEAYRRMREYMTGSPQCLPFALTVINVGSELLRRMQRDPGYLAQMLFGERTVADFAFYVDELLLRFERYWLRRRPENIMAYNAAWAAFARRGLK